MSDEKGASMLPFLFYIFHLTKGIEEGCINLFARKPLTEKLLHELFKILSSYFIALVIYSSVVFACVFAE